jgi:hypothetical protein
MAHIIGVSGKAGSGKDTVGKYLVDHHGFIAMSLADEMKRFCKQVFGFTDDQLWGPSASRNAVDERFLGDAAWDGAAEVLANIGPQWCEMLATPSMAHNEDFSVPERWYGRLEVWFEGLRTASTIRGLSPRVALQTIGTEWGRSCDMNVWIDATVSIAKLALMGGCWYTREGGVETIPKRVEREHTMVGDPPPVPNGVVIPDVRFRNEIWGIQHSGGKVIRVKRSGIVLAPVGVAGHASEAEMDSIQDEVFDYVLDSPEGLEFLFIHLKSFLPPILEKLS